MSFKSFGQLHPRLTSRESRCFCSDSVAYPIGREKDGTPAYLYKNVINYVFHQELMIESVSNFFSCKLLQNKVPQENRLLPFLWRLGMVVDLMLKKSKYLCTEKFSFKNLNTNNVSEKNKALTKEHFVREEKHVILNLGGDVFEVVFFRAVEFAFLNIVQGKIVSLFDMLSDQKFANLNFHSLFLKIFCYLTIISLFWKYNTFFCINKTSWKHREARLDCWGFYM